MAANRLSNGSQDDRETQTDRERERVSAADLHIDGRQLKRRERTDGRRLMMNWDRDTSALNRENLSVINNDCLLFSNGCINSNLMPPDLLLLTLHGLRSVCVCVCVCESLIKAECSSYWSTGFKPVSFSWLIVFLSHSLSMNSSVHSDINCPHTLWILHSLMFCSVNHQRVFVTIITCLSNRSNGWSTCFRLDEWYTLLGFFLKSTWNENCIFNHFRSLHIGHLCNYMSQRNYKRFLWIFISNFNNILVLFKKKNPVNFVWNNLDQ